MFDLHLRVVVVVHEDIETVRRDTGHVIDARLRYHHCLQLALTTQ